MADLGSSLLTIPGATDTTRGVQQGLQLKDLMNQEQMQQIQLGEAQQAETEKTAQRQLLKGVDWTDPKSVMGGIQKLSKAGYGDLAMQLTGQYQKIQSGQLEQEKAKSDLQISQHEVTGQFLDTIGTNATDLLNMMTQSKDPAQGFAQAKAEFMKRLPEILQQVPDIPQAQQIKQQLIGFANSPGANDPAKFKQALMSEIQQSTQGRAILQKQQADALAQRKETATEQRDAAYEQQVKQGKLVPVEGPDKSVTYMPASQASGQKVGKVGGASAAGLTPEGQNILSEAVLEGVSLPTGGSRSAPVIASIFNNLAKQHPGMAASDIVAEIKSGEINMKGLSAETSAVGRRQAGIETSAEEARNVIPIALKASADIPRGQFVPLNKLIQAGQVATSNPKLAAFAQANLTLANVYARAMSPTGTPTVEGREEALKKLSQATSPESYKAVVDVIVQEINAARSAPSAIAADIQARTTGGPGAGVQAPLTTGGAPATSAGGSAPITATGPNGQKLVLQNGKWVAQPVANDQLPPLPPGFTLDAQPASQQALPPLPAGFKLDQAPETYGQSIARTGAAVDTAAEAGGHGEFSPVTLGRTAVGAGENALAMASGVVGDIAGAATSIATQNPKRGEAVKQAVQYQPRTATGKAGQTYIGAVAAPVARAFEKIPQALDKAGHPILAQTAQAAEDVMPLRIPKALSEAREAVRPAAEAVAKAGEERASTSAAEAAPKADLIRRTRKLGLKLTSQDVGAPVGKRIEAMASRPQLEREISVDNAPKVKQAAAADVDIKGPLTVGKVNEAINQTLTPYKAPRTLGRIDLAADTKWKTKLREIEGTTEQETKDFPKDTVDKVKQEIAKFDVDNADADSLTSKIAKLRERASDNFRGNADDKALARAQRQIATAMEESIERHGEKIGRMGTIKDFRAARTKLAKLYTIRDAMTPSGELDLGVLEDALNKKEQLTGNLRTLAEAKAAFDRSFQNPDNIRAHPVGLADVGLGALAYGAKGAAAGHLPGAAAGLVAGAARPVTRMLLKSRPYERAFIKPRTPKASAVSRVARRVAGPHRLADAKEATEHPSTLGKTSTVQASARSTPKTINLSGMGAAIGKNARDQLWTAYQRGSTKMAGINDPILIAAKKAGIKFGSRHEFDKFIDHYFATKH